jgi:hypothetical protein
LFKFVPPASSHLFIPQLKLHQPRLHTILQPSDGSISLPLLTLGIRLLIANQNAGERGISVALRVPNVVLAHFALANMFPKK